MYGLRGFGDAAASVPCPANPTLLSGTTACDAATLAAVPPKSSASIIKDILFPTSFSGVAGGIQLAYTVGAWGAIGLAAWLLFSGGKR